MPRFNFETQTADKKSDSLHNWSVEVLQQYRQCSLYLGSDGCRYWQDHLGITEPTGIFCHKKGESHKVMIVLHVSTYTFAEILLTFFKVLNKRI